MHASSRPLFLSLLILPAVGVSSPALAAPAGLTVTINHDDGGRTSKRHQRILLKALNEEGCPAVVSPVADGKAADLIFDSRPPAEMRGEESGNELIAQAITEEGKAIVRGAILVKASTGSADLTSLQGERMAFVGEKSWSGYILPQKLLNAAGVKPEPDTVFFSANHAGAVTMVLHGDVFAAAVAEPLAKRWADANDLSIVDVTEEVETGGWWMRAGVSTELVQRCGLAFARLEKTSLKALPAWIHGFKDLTGK